MRLHWGNIVFGRLLPIILGSALYAFGLHYFVVPNELMEGGITGISLLLYYAAELPPSYTTLLLNIPLFYFGFKVFGKQAMLYTIVGTVSLSLSLWLMERFIAAGWLVPFHTDHDLLLATLYAGVTLGAGLGIVFRFGGTTGGIDIVARLINRWKRWGMGQIILVLDAAIISLSLIYIPREKVLYTLVAVFVASKMIDFIADGAYASKAFAIITNFGEKIAKEITLRLERGATIVPARGAYSGKGKDVVYCVVSRQEAIRLQGIVREVDPDAFIVVTSVENVIGEGFGDSAEQTAKS